MNDKGVLLPMVVVVSLVLIFAIFANAIMQDTPEPPRIPAAVSDVTPIDTTNREAQHIIIDNLPTGVPAATYVVPLTATAGYPGCPTKDGGLCQIPAPVLTVPTTVIAPCSTETMATFVPGDICRWEDVTPTVTQQEEPF